MELVILAAGQGSRIFNKIKKNKCLINIKRTTLIEKVILDFRSINTFSKVKIVVGYKKDNIIRKLNSYKNIQYIYNKDYKSREMLYSLKLGIQNAKSDLIVSYSDIIFSKKIFSEIFKLKNKKNFLLPINKNWKNIWIKRNKEILSDCESLIHDKKFNLKEIGNSIQNIKQPMGQFMGVFYIPKNKLKKTLNLIELNKKNKKMHTTNFIDFLVKKNEKVKCIPSNSYWYEFDDYEDYVRFKKK